MSKFLKVRHPFRFKITGDDEKPRVITAWAKVVRGIKPVELVLRADDVRRSIQLGGIGNTQTCSMAVCAKRQADAFPHPVEGLIDWTYRVAYVVSKIGPSGLPVQCVAYSHDDNVAQLNDSKGGQRKLLRGLEEGGDRVIRLHPYRKQKARPVGRPFGGRTGARSQKVIPRGAALRFAVAQVGGVNT